MGYQVCDHDHINDLGKEIVDVSIKAGWVEQDRIERREFGTMMALLHSEVSEALEEYRDGRGLTETYFRDEQGHIWSLEQVKRLDIGGPLKPEGIPVELADVAIRLFYTAEIYGIDLEAAIRLKLDFNKSRPVKHGGKRV